MTESGFTCWTMIRGAAAGDAAHRDAFARRYAPVIRSYLGARWGRTPLSGEVDDAMQEVFLDCFKANGALDRVDPQRGPGFRAFLYGVVRNVAVRREQLGTRRREVQPTNDLRLERISSEEEPLSRVFDRAWCRSVVQAAAERQLQMAKEKGDRAVRRHRLLSVRYGEGLPIREIAKAWDVEADWLHGQFRQAREEFRRALRETVREMTGDNNGSVDAECERLMQLFA
jgi:RNA polymerase sigma-70 factor (ECF subfamily)